MKLPKISQSLMKALSDYGEAQKDVSFKNHGVSACGYYIKARYFDKDPDAQDEPSEAMKHGIYFEYLCTGALPKDGQIPQPKKKANGQLTEDYERITQAADFFKRIIKKHKIVIKQIGLYLETPDGENGIIDIDAVWKNKRVFIDTKYSGLINDRWNEMGWDIDTLPEKTSITIQAKHYKLLAKKCLGIEDIPFYFFVFNSKDPNDAKIIEIDVDEVAMQYHVVQIENTKTSLEYLATGGLRPMPSLKRCNECPVNLRAKCPHREEYPQIIKVSIDK